MTEITQIILDHYYIALAIISFLSFVAYALVRVPIYNVIKYFGNNEGNNDNEFPQISVVLVCHNEASLLKENIENILSQDYDAGFEVVVINDASTDETTDVLNELEHKYSNVRHSFTSNSVRYLSHSKLAITLGVRSAHNPWIVLTSVDCKPKSNQWLKEIGRQCTDERDLVLGYVNYSADSVTNILQKKVCLERFVRNIRSLYSVKAGRKAIGGDCCNLAFRRSKFIETKGFSSNLNLLRGEELLIENLATEGRTAVVLSENSIVEQYCPMNKKVLNTNQLVSFNAERHISKRNKRRRISWSISSMFYLIYLASLLSIIVLSITNRIYMLAIIAFLVGFALNFTRYYVAKQCASKLCTDLSYILFEVYELMQAPRYLKRRILCFLNRKDYVRGL